MTKLYYKWFNRSFIVLGKYQVASIKYHDPKKEHLRPTRNLDTSYLILLKLVFSLINGYG